MEQQGFICPSSSPCGAPTLFVPKKDSNLRLYINYRTLNSITIKDRCPLPLIKETLNYLTGSKYFTTLDLKDTYYRIRIRKGNKQKTTFRTRYGYFKYKVILFRLTNTPATFQVYVNRSLAGLLNNVCIVFLDDILIYTYSDSLEEYQVTVRKVLARLREAKLFYNLKKYIFVVQEVVFLGFRISRQSVKSDPKKVRTI